MPFSGKPIVLQEVATDCLTNMNGSHPRRDTSETIRINRSATTMHLLKFSNTAGLLVEKDCETVHRMRPYGEHTFGYYLPTWTWQEVPLPVSYPVILLILDVDTP